ncbi:unnamed protein product [Brachionus calyciflorus]|uniref:SHSP domain-containing protein n=1 Tax=Brachionus calyciflorus TaxID=104777 RepID=A0A813T4P5_9BILA|nr:unnamed protein product [Brachionus calyciflorus]
MSLIPRFNSISRKFFEDDPFFQIRPLSLDFFDPFDEMDRKFDRHLRWLNRPNFADFPSPFKSISVPEKYRITVDCAGFNPKSIKTEVLGNKVVVSAREEDRANSEDYSIREFKKTYDLPKNAQGDKLASFVTNEGKLVIEAPLKKENQNLSSDFGFPKISDDGKSVSLNFSLPEKVDPSKINVTCKDREIIIKAEDKQEKEDGMSSFSFYQRSTLPENTDFNAIKCQLENQTLKLNAPILENPKQNFRQIPIEHVKQ